MNNKSKICLLHIGAPKTGSTALQKFLFSNKELLSKSGWEYPDVNLRGFGHHDLAFLLGGGYPSWALPQDRSLEALINLLIDSVEGLNQMVISSENFFLFPNPSKTSQVLEQSGFPHEFVKIVIYIRRQDEAIISYYNQMVKAQGYTGTIQDYISESRDLWNYEIQLKLWGEIFGHENLIVKLYQEDELKSGDIRHDFLQLMQLPPDDFQWPQELTNTRINRDILEFQRLVNKLPLSFPERRRFHRELIELTSATSEMRLFNDCTVLDTTQRKEILSYYTDSNIHVAEKYLGLNYLFNESMPAETLSKERFYKLDPEKIVYILGWILARGEKV